MNKTKTVTGAEAAQRAIALLPKPTSGELKSTLMETQSDGALTPLNASESSRKTTLLRNEWQVKWLNLDATFEVQQAADAVQRFTGRFALRSNGHRHFVLAGDTGTGKTHMAGKVYRWASAMRVWLWSDQRTWAHPPRVELADWGKIVALESEEFRTWLGDLNSCDLLCLEDIGAEVDRFKTGEPAERLRELLNDFKSNFLFITTNIMPEQWGEKWDKRIADRLMRDSEIFALRETESYAARRAQ